MILTKEAIKNRIENCNLIENYDEEMIGSVSVDLRIDSIITEEDIVSEYELEPGDTVFVKTIEKLKMPLDLVGIIEEKNSRMRQGLVVSGPRYQPGHETVMYLRVSNISTNVIRLSKGVQIAQIYFETLMSKAQPYSGTFQNETVYRGFGNYKDQYEAATIRKVKKEKEDLETLSNKIYANILTLMGIFVSIFSIVTVNFSNFVQSKPTVQLIVTMNLTLALCIATLMGLVYLVIHKKNVKTFTIVYFVILILLAISVIVISILL